MRTAIAAAPIFCLIFGLQAIILQAQTTMNEQSPAAAHSGERQPMTAEQAMQSAHYCLAEDGDFRLLLKLIEKAQKSAKKYTETFEKAKQAIKNGKPIWSNPQASPLWIASQEFIADRAAAEIQMGKVNANKLQCVVAYAPGMVVSARPNGEYVMQANFEIICRSLDSITEEPEHELDQLHNVLLVYLHFRLRPPDQTKQPGSLSPPNPPRPVQVAVSK